MASVQYLGSSPSLPSFYLVFLGGFRGSRRFSDSSSFLGFFFSFFSRSADSAGFICGNDESEIERTHEEKKMAFSASINDPAGFTWLFLFRFRRALACSVVVVVVVVVVAFVFPSPLPSKRLRVD